MSQASSFGVEHMLVIEDDFSRCSVASQDAAFDKFFLASLEGTTSQPLPTLLSPSPPPSISTPPVHEIQPPDVFPGHANEEGDSSKVTQFLEGGVVVAISHSHIAMDGPSLWQFWVSWGECAGGVPLSKPPILARTVFKPDNVSHEIAKLVQVEMKPKDITNNNSNIPLVNRVLHFDSEVMKKLKDMGIDAQNKVEGPNRRVSSLEVLFAHCWRHVTQARMLPDEQELSFIVFADMRRGRSNMDAPPPVPEDFFGNAITWTCAKATPCILRNESFAATLARIAKLVDDCVHPSNLQGMIHWLELFEKRSHPEPMWFSGVNINVASSLRFPTHLVDFG
ncbi:hypothetical protein L7F22_034504 [Adiantum nelumboides]|nr:hypothetical protein [Adiantum nelumboides]